MNEHQQQFVGSSSSLLSSLFFCLPPYSFDT